MLHLPGVGEPSINDFLEPSSKSLQVLNEVLESYKSCATVGAIREVELEFRSLDNKDTLGVHVFQDSDAERGGSVAFTLLNPDPHQSDLRITAGAYDDDFKYLLQSANVSEQAQKITPHLPENAAAWLGKAIGLLYKRNANYDGDVEQLLETSPYPVAEHRVYSLGRRLPDGGYLTYLHHEGNARFLEIMEDWGLRLHHTHLIEPTSEGRIMYDYSKYSRELGLTVEGEPAPKKVNNTLSLRERIAAMKPETYERPLRKLTEANVQRFISALWAARVAIGTQSMEA